MSGAVEEAVACSLVTGSDLAKGAQESELITRDAVNSRPILTLVLLLSEIFLWFKSGLQQHSKLYSNTDPNIVFISFRR
jgi:hypothetical protein